MELATILDEALALRLKVARKDAVREMQAQAKIGQAIRAQRIREMRDLEEARREKQEWIQRTLELLGALVNQPEWAEQFNDYVPTILPEYAEFDMFVEIFEEEMRYRLNKLQAMMKSLNDIPEPLPLQQPSAPGSAPARTPHPEVVHVFAEEPMSPPPAALTPTASAAATTAAIVNPLVEPEPPLRPVTAPAHAPSSAIHGALIVRTPDDALRQSIALFMQRMDITLHLIDRQSASGKSMMDLLVAQRNLNFAMVLVDASNGTASTPDDLFDLGCCVGRLGGGRVYAIHRGGDGSPDRYGIAHIPVDGTEGWQLTLARHLKKAGVPVDLNKLV